MTTKKPLTKYRSSLAYPMGVATCLLLLLCTLCAQAEEIGEIFDRTKKLIAENNYPKAIKELQWAENELQKMHLKQLGEFFPDSLGDLSAGKATPNSAMGMIEFKKTYNNDKKKLQLTLMGGSLGGQGNPLGQIARFGAMMGANNAQESLRIKGKTATLKQSGNNTELTMFLDSGYMLKLDSRHLDKEAVEELAKTLDLDKLDTYLMG